MFRFLRTLHKWIGITGALFLIAISITGFLLAIKGSASWMRPPEMDGGDAGDYSQIVSIEQVMSACFAQNHPQMKTAKDIDRIDYRPKSNVFKVLAKEGYFEIQVDGSTGKVLQVAARNDQLVEDLHDFSFFADMLHKYGLPVVAVILFGLGFSGVWIFFTPIVRRRQFAKKQALENRQTKSE